LIGANVRLSKESLARSGEHGFLKELEFLFARFSRIWKTEPGLKSFSNGFPEWFANKRLLFFVTLRRVWLRLEQADANPF
jgi:hypothetical protein